MAFVEAYPTVTLLLGDKNVRLLDDHLDSLRAGSEDTLLRHFETCPIGSWCALNATPECRHELQAIEASLMQILTSPNIDDARLRKAFSRKAVNPRQYDQLLAEITTAATAATRATLLDLEWPTGKQHYDADVRMEICGEPVNLEVTLRTDAWADEVAIHMEDILDEDGNLIGDIPTARSRRTLTERQLDDLKQAGLQLPTPATRRRENPPETVFVSNPTEFPECDDGKPYCADGDNPNVEARNVERCVRDKAQKFNADGFHIVVLATLRPGFPSESTVFDALFGQSPKIQHHGLFESGSYNEICGVIYLPVYQHLHRLQGETGIEGLAKLFVNHHASIKPPEQLQVAIAEVFEAEIRRGWLN